MFHSHPRLCLRPLLVLPSSFRGSKSSPRFLPACSHATSVTALASALLTTVCAQRNLEQSPISRRMDGFRDLAARLIDEHQDVNARTNREDATMHAATNTMQIMQLLQLIVGMWRTRLSCIGLPPMEHTVLGNVFMIMAQISMLETMGV